jgi:Ca2+/H+ antiporter
MAAFAVIFVLLAGGVMGVALATIGGLAGALVGVPLLGGAARADVRRRAASADRMIFVPLAVVLGMFLLPRLFDAIGLSLGWALAAGASAFVAAAVYATSRSSEIFGGSG